MLISISIFYFFCPIFNFERKKIILITIQSNTFNKKTYKFIIVIYAYYLNIDPNTIRTIINKYYLLFIYISYSIL